MTLEEYIEEIKFELTGDLLNSEITDDGYAKIVNYSLREINRYYDNTSLVQTTASRCVDLAQLEKDNNISIYFVSNIYRSKPVGGGTDTTNVDPMSIMQWNLNNFTTRGFSNAIYNYLSVSTTEQISNTLSTDLDYKEDVANRKLYINYSSGMTGDIVIEYVPKLEDVSQITGDFWVDILHRLSLARAKTILGRIRTRYTQSNALWTQDGETMLNEGKEELTAIRERLQTYSNYIYPID